jgi:hypothetical protein
VRSKDKGPCPFRGGLHFGGVDPWQKASLATSYVTSTRVEPRRQPQGTSTYHDIHITVKQSTAHSTLRNINAPTETKFLCGAAMMRNKTSSSLQKTYDECYLICSTAVYFEGQVRNLSFFPPTRINRLLFGNCLYITTKY